MKEYPAKLPHSSGRMMTFDPRRLLRAFEEHSSQQDVNDRFHKKQDSDDSASICHEKHGKTRGTEGI
jgi:hypothetical protein